MKLRPAIILAALLSLAGWPAIAASSFIYETPAEFLASGDFNGDGMPDVLVVDKITGNARVGYGDASGNLTWSAPLPTGVPTPTGITIGWFLTAGRDALAVTSPILNAVNLVDLSATNTAGAPIVVTPSGLGPHSLVALANALGGAPPAYSSLLVASSHNANGAELLDALSINAGIGNALGEATETGPFERGNAVQLSPAAPTLAAGLVRGTNDVLDLWQFTNPPAVMLSYSNQFSGADYTFGVFNGETLPRFLFYQPGGTNLTLIPLQQTSGGYRFGAPWTTNFSSAIAGVYYVNLGTDGAAMILFTNGVQSLTIPRGVPTLGPLYGAAAPGNSFTGVVPLANGRLALLEAPAGSPASVHARVWHFDGTNYVPLSAGDLPATTAHNTRANVWLFQSEPLVNRQPGFLASYSSPDWSDSRSGLPGAITVRTETDAGTNGGLGSATTTHPGAPPTGTAYGLVNQYAGAISLFSFNAPQPPPPVTVTIAPPPGIYDGPIAISFSTLNSSDQVRYRVGETDSWHAYVTGSPFTLTNDNTVQFYGLTAGSAARSPLQTAAYSLGNNGVPAALVNLTTGTTVTNPPVQTNPAPRFTLSTSVGTIFYGRRSASNQGTIWAISYDGSDDTYITTGVRPRASKDGRFLAFLREGNPFNSQGNLWMRDMQSGAEQRLLVNTNTLAGYDWEPDDSGLVLDYACGIWKLGIDGSLTQLFHSNCYAQAPVLSPLDGSISFHNLITGMNPSPAGLYVANPNGINTRIIVTNVAGASWPAWSPDGRLLAFADHNGIPSLDGGTNLWVVAPDGSKLSRICDFTGTDNRFPHGAIWSPDGTALVGAATLFTTNGLWVIPLNADRNDCGGGAVRLPTTPGDAIDFAGSVVLDTGKPIFITQPFNISPLPGELASVTVTVSGQTPLYYEWIKDGVLLPQQTNSTIIFPAFQLTNSGVYQVVVTNAVGMAISRPARLGLVGAPLRGWGPDEIGELGDGKPLNSGNFTNVPVFMGSNVVAEASGAGFSMFVTEDGSLWTTGFNSQGQLGLGGAFGLGTTIQDFDNLFYATNQPLRVTGNVVAVAAGSDHALFLKQDGSLWSMGNNSEGQLGVGAFYLPYPQAFYASNVICLGCGPLTVYPAPLPVASDVVAVAAGRHHSLFLKSDGTLWGMGDNTYGELASGGVPSSATPVFLADHVILAAGGAWHSLFVKVDGTLWGSGMNALGQLGIGTNQNAAVPVPIATNVVNVAAGLFSSYFVTADGLLWSMGENDYGQLGVGVLPHQATQTNRPTLVATNVTSVAAVQDLAYFIRHDGSLWGMGYNAAGGLALSQPLTVSSPVLIHGGGLMASSVATGPSGSGGLAVVGAIPIVTPLTDQTVLPGQSYDFTVTYTNGDGATTIQWQLNGTKISGATSATLRASTPGLYTAIVLGTYGGGTASAHLYFKESPTILSQPIGGVVAAGQPASLSVTANVTSPLSYMWMKEGTLLPNQTNSTLSFSSFQLPNSGAYQVVITNTSGMVISGPALLSVPNAPLRAWGYNGYGDLGDGGSETSTNLPELIASNVVAEASGEQHSLFVTADGNLWAMGYNGDGELGTGTYANTNRPGFVTNNVVAVAAGTTHSMFLKADGTLWSMGRNNYGQLGIGNFYTTNRPVWVASNAVALAAGDQHSLYITSDGLLWAMGEGYQGQLGAGNLLYTNRPVAVASNVVNLAAGYEHSLYVTADGSLWGMGYNQDGELGIGNYTNTNLPVWVTGNVLAVAAGLSHSLFITADGMLHGMGQNGYGELGVRNLNQTNQPIIIASNVVAAAAGEQDSLYLTGDGNLWGLGNDQFDQLGGVTLGGNIPALVNGGGLVAASLSKGPMAFHSLAVAGAIPVIAALTNLTITPTQPAAFTAVVSGGDGPFSYQWQLNGTPITGATNSTYRVASASAADAGLYMVSVTGAYGTASSHANLTVNYSPMIAGQPAGGAAQAGQAVALSVTATSFLTPTSYGWIKDGALLPGQTGSALNIASFQLTNSGSYQVVVSNAAGIAVSRHALWSLANAPLRDWGYNGVGGLGIGSFSNTNAPTRVTNDAVVAAAGGAHSLYIRSDRTLWAMGDNSRGQLGLGALNFTNLPTWVASNVLAVAAGFQHSLYVTADGTLWGMGYNASGQLGNGSFSNAGLPVPVASNVVAVAAGANHSLYLMADGTVWGMGHNLNGELGIGTLINAGSPVKVATNVVAMAAGGLHSLLITVDQHLWAMGYNGVGALGTGTLNNTNLPVNVASNVVNVAAGGDHSLFVTADGRLWGMGFNQDGELGIPGNGTAVLPVPVTTNVVGIAAGVAHSLYSMADGSLWSMGLNSSGQLGDGSTISRNFPVRVNGGGLTAASLAQGPAAAHSLAVAGVAPVVTVNSNQTVFPGQSFSFSAVIGGGDGPFSYQWRMNGAALPNATNATYTGTNAGAVSIGTYTAVVTGAYGVGQAGAMLNVNFVPTIAGQPVGSVVSLGQPASVAVTAVSLLIPTSYQWLKDGVRLSGQGSSTLSFASFQLTNSGIYQVVVSNAAGIALSRPARLSVGNAPLRGWGAGYYGQLGNLAGSVNTLPAEIAGNVVAAAAGGEHSLYVTTDGQLWSMGYNGYGQLGNGTYGGTAPGLIASNVVGVAAGQNHSLYVTADGKLWAMGSGLQGQLGLGPLAGTNRPVLVATNVVATAAGLEHSLYLTADGVLWGMGYNGDGELGNGANGNTNRPVSVATNVISVAAGGSHSLFLTADGALFGMGYNLDGELGNGTYNSTNRPTPLAANVLGVAAGEAHSLYITADGNLWAMGDDFYGQLGDGLNHRTNRAENVAGSVTAVAAGAAHSLFVTADGTLWAMGYNGDGELGDGGLEGATNRPVKVNAGDMVTASLAKGPVAAHSLAVAGAAPLVTGMPDQTVFVGQPFAFSPSIAPGGDAPATYQWQLDGINIPEATNAVYGGGSARLGDAGSYTLVVTGPFNQSSGGVSATLTVLVQPTAPAITTPPVSATANLGQPLGVGVTVSGTPPVSYAWLKDGAWLPGQTNDSIRFASFQLTNSGAYQVAVSNSLGLVISPPALLSVANVPLLAWGNDNASQLGDGGFGFAQVPETVATNVVIAALGAQHSIYVTADGTLWAMGYNADGELGDGSGNPAGYPEIIATNVVGVAAGESHSLYLTADSTLWAMGNNGDGQLGNGGYASQLAAAPMATNVIALAAGGNHSLYVTADGLLWAVGNNADGELGDGNPETSLAIPEIVATNVVAIAAGSKHSLFLKTDGTLWAMGDNHLGQLGDGGVTISTNLPEMIATNVLGMAAGSFHSLFITGEGNLWAMGDNGLGQLGDGGLCVSTNVPEVVAGNVEMVSAGVSHSLFVTSDGKLWAMGDNMLGELGNGSGASSPSPVLVNGGGYVTAGIARGEAASHALAAAGALPEVYVPYQVLHFGDPVILNAIVYGGQGPFTYQWQLYGTNLAGATNASLSVSSITDTNVYDFSVVVTGTYGSSTAYAYLNFITRPTIYTQTGSITSTTGQPAGLEVFVSSVVPVTYQWLKEGVRLPNQTNGILLFTDFEFTNAGSYQAVVSNEIGIAISQPMFLSVSNSLLLAWGANSNGQLGDTRLSNTNRPEVIATDIAAAAAGARHSLYITADENLWAMGQNSYGQLGDSTFTDTNQPTVITPNVVAAAAGGGHSLYLTSDGRLWAMGRNDNGQLGDGTLTNVPVPEVVAAAVVAIAAGDAHSLYLVADGSLWTMGRNAHGQLGNGSLNDTNRAVVVASNVVAIAAGGDHSLYLQADGSLWGMGRNNLGQLGNGLTNDTNRPVLLASQVLSMAAGANHSLYLKNDNTLWSFGANAQGQLGNHTTSDTNRPVKIATEVVAVAAGFTHSLYETADGALWAMGDNSQGQLGNGLAANSTVPTLVNQGGLMVASLARGPVASQGMVVAEPAPPPAGPVIIAIEVAANPAGAGRVITFTVDPIQSYGVQVTTDFTHWTSLGTFSPDASGRFTVTDTGATSAARFYRLSR